MHTNICLCAQNTTSMHLYTSHIKDFKIGMAEWRTKTAVMIRKTETKTEFYCQYKYKLAIEVHYCTWSLPTTDSNQHLHIKNSHYLKNAHPTIARKYLLPPSSSLFASKNFIHHFFHLQIARKYLLPPSSSLFATQNFIHHFFHLRFHWPLALKQFDLPSRKKK